MSEIVYPEHFKDESSRSAFRQGYSAGVSSQRLADRSKDPEYASLQQFGLEQAEHAEALALQLKAVREALEIAVQIAEQILHGNATPHGGAKLIADHSRATLLSTIIPTGDEDV